MRYAARHDGRASIYKLLIFLTVFFAFFMFMPPRLFAQDGGGNENERTIITIGHAQMTVYEKDEETGNDLIVLEGDVRLSVVKGDATTGLVAQRITYDRKTQMLYASGGVSMEQTDANGGTTTATASALMLNTSTLEGVFDDGRAVQTQTDAINLPSGSTLIVASDMFGRSQSNTIAFKNGSLTFCDAENPHWHIDATRIWLLPGGEFAFFNALLYVGIVPVAYLPAFYYPKDELVFHPVFSYDQRRGYSIQTTTYLYGRKPLSAYETTSGTDGEEEEETGSAIEGLFNFMRPTTLKEQRLEGIVLHNLDEDYTGDTTNYFKMMGDWHSNLGFLVGFDGVLKPNDYITNVRTALQFAFSNTAFKGTPDYSPYSPLGKKYWNSSNFMGMSLPFRYGANFEFTLAKPFSLSLSMPIYSDPFFTDDFSERNETMDWIGYLMSMGSRTEEEYTPDEISSFSWTLSSSYSPPLPSVINPYLSSVSISTDSSFVFNSLVNSVFTRGLDEDESSALSRDSPERKFYYPSQITPVNASLSLSGTIFSWSLLGTAQTQADGEPAVPLLAPDELKTEAEKADEAANAESAKSDGEELDGTEANGVEESANSETLLANGAEQASGTGGIAHEDAEQAKEPFDASIALPVFATSNPSVTTVPGFDYRLGYSATPSINTQLAYSSTGLNEPKDFEWSRLQSSMYTLRVPLTLTSEVKYAGDFFTLTNGFTYDPVVQRHPYISTDTDKGGYSASAEASLKRTDFTASKQEIINTNSVSIKPFAYIPMFKNTGVTYSSTIKLLRSEFLGDEDKPDWKYYGPDFTERDSITAHELAFTYAMSEGKNDAFTQSLVFAMTLPPQVDRYTATLSLGFPYVTFMLAGGFERTSATDDTWRRRPIQQTFAVSIFKNPLEFRESYNYNWEDYHSDAFRLSLSWSGLEAAYTMSYTRPYDFDDDSGWVQQSEDKFIPYSFSFSYDMTAHSWYIWKRRIKIAPGLSTAVVADLVRPTNSYFTFTPSLNFEINEFLTVTFSTTSRNSVIYRYFQKALGAEGRIPGETNPFIDLVNSFRFDDESKRRASGFKLQSLNLSITHDLHDWDVRTELRISPRLVTESGVTPYYDFSPYAVISVVWRPMESMRTRIVDEYGEWELNP